MYSKIKNTKKYQKKNKQIYKYMLTIMNNIKNKRNFKQKKIGKRRRERDEGEKFVI